MRLKEVQVQEDPNENVNVMKKDQCILPGGIPGPTLMPGLGWGLSESTWWPDLCKWARPGAEHRSNSWLMELGCTLLD